jgi:branched-chain amino acid transport system substrate-binding protein
VDYILCWTYIPQTASILKETKMMGWDVTLIGNNTTAYRLMFPIAKQLAEGYLAVTPFAPWEDVSPKVKDIIRKYSDFPVVDKAPFPAPMFLASWVYFAAMIEGIKNAGRNLTPETLIKGIESINQLKMDGMCPDMSFGPKRHVGYFSSRVLRADTKNMRFHEVAPIADPKAPQD